MTGNHKKHSYTISCSSAFRDEVVDLARRRGVNVADLARSVVLMVPPENIAAFPDPGEPVKGDRETVILKSGNAKGKPWRRKPRLQVRMAPGLEVSMIRRALGLVLSMDRGDLGVKLGAKMNGVKSASAPPPKERVERDGAEEKKQRALISEIRDEMERLRTIVSVLSFEPLANGVQDRDDALHVLGFPPGCQPDERDLRSRFRMLATIHHPDSNYGSHQRMSQLNAAVEYLRRGAA